MHTDEYEISLGREILLCRRNLERLDEALQKKEQRYGMKTEQFLQNSQVGRLREDNADFRDWAQDHRQRQTWWQKLQEYEQALAAVKRM